MLAMFPSLQKMGLPVLWNDSTAEYLIQYLFNFITDVGVVFSETDTSC